MTPNKKAAHFVLDDHIRASVDKEIKRFTKKINDVFKYMKKEVREGRVNNYKKFKTMNIAIKKIEDYLKEQQKLSHKKEVHGDAIKHDKNPKEAAEMQTIKKSLKKKGFKVD